jgi:hypothetical protein
MSVTDELLANNERYAEAFHGPLPLPPSAHLAVVACMDARLNVYAILGLEEGQAHVIRNAGGVVTDDAGMGGGGLPRPGRGRPAVDRPDQGEPVHPAHRRCPGLRVRRGHRPPARSQVSEGGGKTRELPFAVVTSLLPPSPGAGR